jgi:hypothetical protein
METAEIKLTPREAWGFGGLMSMAAFRYCLGRMTYIVTECVDWIIPNWDNFHPSIRVLIELELEEAFVKDDDMRQEPYDAGGGDFYLPLGHDCDRRQWERVRKLWNKKED